MIEAPQPDQPQGSFSERYRNIPYGPEAASAPPAAPAHRRLPLRLLVVGGIAVAIVVGALLGSQLLPSSATSPNANARRPSPPPASVDPGKQVMAKFWSVVRNPVLSYHIAAAGSWTGPAGTGSFISSLDVAGDDYSGSITEKGAGNAGTTRIIRKDPFTWSKLGSRPWIPLLTNDPAERSLPFLYLDTQAALAYAGPVDRDGQHLHLLRSTDAYQPYVTGLLNLTSFELSKDLVQLEVYVTEQGVPVAADFVCEAGGLRANGKPVFRGTAERSFSKFGAEYTIVPPGS